MEEVKQAINSGSLLSVRLAGIRYITYWRSGLGYYASIELSRAGFWSRLAVNKPSSF